MVILIISHIHLLREALVAALHGTGDGEAFGASSHETVDAVAREFPPSVVVVDASHPEGLTLVAGVRAQLPQVKVVVLAMRERNEDLFAWADIGIAGYLGPDTSTREMLAAVRRVQAGEAVCSPRLSALLLNRLATRSNERSTRGGIHELTPREREIAKLLATGMSNKLIARQLRLAVPTVKNHVHSILEKWDLRSRGEAAAHYRQWMQKDAEPSGPKFTGPGTSHGSQSSGSTWRTSEMRIGMPPPSGVTAGRLPTRAIPNTRINPGPHRLGPA